MKVWLFYGWDSMASAMGEEYVAHVFDSKEKADAELARREAAKQYPAQMTGRVEEREVE